MHLLVFSVKKGIVEMCEEWQKISELGGALNPEFPLLLTKIKVKNEYSDHYLFAGAIGGEQESAIYIQCPNPYAGCGAMYTVWGEMGARAEARKLGFAEDMYVEENNLGKYFEV